jgi:Ni/Co efflux regulator RcnB
MRRILAAALAVTLLTGSVVAEARDHDRDSRHDVRGHRDHDRHAHHRDSDRRVVRHVERDVHRHVDVSRHARFHAGHYYRPVGYRAYAWHRGARLPAAYYAPRYVIHDYRAYHLYAPPRGHHWVRVDNDVVLAAITTGVVVAVVNNLFY